MPIESQRAWGYTSGVLRLLLGALILLQSVSPWFAQAADSARSEKALDDAEAVARRLLSTLPPEEAVSGTAGGKSRGKLDIAIIPRKAQAAIPRPEIGSGNLSALCGRAVFTDAACFSADMAILSKTLRHAQDDLESTPLIYAGMQMVPGAGTQLSLLEFVNDRNWTTGSTLGLSFFPGALMLTNLFKGSTKAVRILAAAERAGQAAKNLSGEVELVNLSGQSWKAMATFHGPIDPMRTWVYSATIDGKDVVVKFPKGFMDVQSLEHEVRAIARVNFLAKAGGFPENFHIQKLVAYGRAPASIAMEIAAEAKPVRILVTEAAPGIPLSQWFKQGKKFSKDSWAGLKKGLDRFHELGLHHGDSGAENILIHEAADGRQHFTLIDFEMTEELAAKGAAAARELRIEKSYIDAFEKGLAPASWVP